MQLQGTAALPFFLSYTVSKNYLSFPRYPFHTVFILCIKYSRCSVVPVFYTKYSVLYPDFILRYNAKHHDQTDRIQRSCYNCTDQKSHRNDTAGLSLKPCSQRIRQIAAHNKTCTNTHHNCNCHNDADCYSLFSITHLQNSADLTECNTQNKCRLFIVNLTYFLLPIVSYIIFLGILLKL